MSLKDLRITDSSITTCSGMTMIKTGEKISLNIQEQCIESGSDLIITSGNGQLNSFTNPACKAVNLGDEKFARNLISVHQVSHTLLLTQSKITEVSQRTDHHHWSLWQLNGTPVEMS